MMLKRSLEELPNTAVQHLIFRVTAYLILTLISSIFFSLSAHANIDQYRSLIEKKARKYGVSPAILTTIVLKESSGKPWSLNIDGEGMHFTSKSSAIRAFRTVMNHRWVLKYKIGDGEYSRRFFKSEQQAVSWLDHRNRGLDASEIQLKLLKGENPQFDDVGDTIVRRLRLVNTDIGIAQINYRWHGKALRDTVKFTHWLDPDFNLDYAAKHMDELIKRHDGNIMEAIAHYHSSNNHLQSLYLERFLPTFKKETKRYGHQVI